jgi:hypothetical protein
VVTGARGRAMGAALALFGASCSQLLGIEEARVDPTLLPDANLADSGTGGAGSSGDDGGAGSQVTETGGGNTKLPWTAARRALSTARTEGLPSAGSTATT